MDMETKKRTPLVDAFLHAIKGMHRHTLKRLVEQNEALGIPAQHHLDEFDRRCEDLERGREGADGETTDPSSSA